MTRIGLLSDSHGNADITRQAVARLMGHGADLLLHLGDVGSTGVIDELVTNYPVRSPDRSQDQDQGRHQRTGQVEAHLVFGNTDWNDAELGSYAQGLDVNVDHPVGTLDAGGKTVVFMHGHDAHAMSTALAASPDYLCHGHTHTPRDERVGDTRVINPGALTRAREYTVAILDLASDSLEFLTLE